MRASRANVLQQDVFGGVQQRRVFKFVRSSVYFDVNNRRCDVNLMRHCQIAMIEE